MNIQNNINIEDLTLEDNCVSRFEIIPTKNFFKFFRYPEEINFAIDAILDCLVNYDMTFMNEDFLLMTEGIIPFYSGKVELNFEEIYLYIFWDKENDYRFLVLDKSKKGDDFKFFNINHEENMKMSKILH